MNAVSLQRPRAALFIPRRCLPIYHVSCCGSSERKQSNGFGRKYSSSGWQLILTSETEMAWNITDERLYSFQESREGAASGELQAGVEIQPKHVWSTGFQSEEAMEDPAGFLLLHSRRWSSDSPHAMTSSMWALQSRFSGIKTENEGYSEMSC